jgi:hypothetical protein
MLRKFNYLWKVRMKNVTSKCLKDSLKITFFCEVFFFIRAKHKPTKYWIFTRTGWISWFSPNFDFRAQLFHKIKKNSNPNFRRIIYISWRFQNATLHWNPSTNGWDIIKILREKVERHRISRKNRIWKKKTLKIIIFFSSYISAISWWILMQNSDFEKSWGIPT